MNEAYEHGDGICLWQTDDMEFHCAVVGTGPGFMSILDIIYNDSYREFIPGMRLAAVAEPGPESHKTEYVNSRGVPIYASWRDMFIAHPEINLVVELSGSSAKCMELRRGLPRHVSLIDQATAVFLCGLHTMLQAGTHCRLDLDRHKSLLEAIIDNIRDDILLLDRESRVADLNRNVVRRSVKTKAELLGLPCWQVQSISKGVPFCHGLDEKCPFTVTLNTGENAEAMFTRVDEEGHLLYYRVYAYPIFNSLGHMTHVMIMRRDITERTFKEKLQQQSEKLSVIGEMSTYLAHEIRNPLFAIGGFSNALLRSPNLDDKEREKVQIIADETKRLDHMLSSILNFAKPRDHGKVAEVDLNLVAQETVELMRIGYAKQGVEFSLEQAEPLAKAKAESETIKQCLVNLIKNSMEAMPDGGTITVQTFDDGDFVAVAVRDTGTGMSKATLEKVFSPFFTTKSKGYGLGMAMIRKVVEDFGGHVDVSSREGEGTTVTMRFPAAMAVDEEEVLNGNSKPTPPGEKPQPA